MVFFGIEEFFCFLFRVHFVYEVTPVIGRTVTLFDNFRIRCFSQKLIPFFSVVKDIGLGNRYVIFPAEASDVLFRFVGKLCIERGDESYMREFSGDFSEGFISSCGNIAYEYVDLFAFDLFDETLFVVFPVVCDGFDFIRPAPEIGVVEEAEYVVEV